MPERLTGAWSLDRRVVERRAGVTGCVHGRLVIRPEGAGLRWDEDGTLTWAGRSVPVSRSLRLRRDGGAWWVFFADGRPFHPWTCGVEVEHECGADIYRGLITLRGAPERPFGMRTVWSVTGPAKDQLLVTRLRRL